jgi:hypothetical protein
MALSATPVCSLCDNFHFVVGARRSAPARNRGTQCHGVCDMCTDFILMDMDNGCWLREIVALSATLVCSLCNNFHFVVVTVSSRPYRFPLSVGSPTSPHTPQTDHGTTSYDTRPPVFPRHRHITLLLLPSLLLSALGLTSSHVVHPHGYYSSSQGIT